MRTSAPWRALSIAMARPMPRDPPVTTTTFLSRILMLIRAGERATGIQANAKSRTVGDLHFAINRHWLIEKERGEHRDYLIGIRRHHQEFGVRAIVARNDEMIAVNARTVRDNQSLMRVREG